MDPLAWLAARQSNGLSVPTPAPLKRSPFGECSLHLLWARVEVVLTRVQVLPLAVPADVEYGTIRQDLESTGRPIGANDLLIAAHARASDATLVTANTTEFSRVQNLTLENWIAPSNPSGTG
jgi:tRNA(fMet)-specific endonuclease VapC